MTLTDLEIFAALELIIGDDMERAAYEQYDNRRYNSKPTYRYVSPSFIATHIQDVTGEHMAWCMETARAYKRWREGFYNEEEHSGRNLDHN